VPLTSEGGGVAEAVTGDGTWAAVADATAADATVRGSRGVFAFESEPGAAWAQPPMVATDPDATPDATPAAGSEAGSAAGPAHAVDERLVGDQTHSSAVVDGARVVKLRRRLGPGGMRELAVGRRLGGGSAFDGAPALLGSILHRADDGTETVLGLIHAFVAGASDGYEATNAAIRAYLLAPDAAGLRASTDAAAQLGRLTARLHRRLAGLPMEGGDGAGGGVGQARGSGADGGVAWTSASTVDRRAMRLAGERSLAEAMVVALTSGRPGGARLATHLARVAPRVASRLALLEDAGVPLASSLGHGDLHLGQTLVTGDGRWLVIDFEGEPVGAVAGAWAPEPPAIRDVAGMLRSFDHVARSASRRVAAARSDDVALDPGGDPLTLLAAMPVDLRTAADRWIAAERRRFLSAYRDGVAEDLGRWIDARAIHGFEIEKECYELAYAARVLPTWTWAPVGGIGWLLAHPPRRPR
jgi:predicted trehalose synthase